MTYRATTARTANAGRKADDSFRPTRVMSAARASLLFGTALGCSIAIMAASPNQAWAADECGADVGGVAVCVAGGNPYPTGIDYTGDAGEDITVILIGGGPGTAVDVVTTTDDGVTVTADPGSDASVISYLGSYLTSDYNGILVDADGGGDAFVDSETVIDAGYSGIIAVADAGDATVLNTGNIYAGGNNPFIAAGIYVEADGFGNTATVDNSGDIYVDGDSVASSVSTPIRSLGRSTSPTTPISGFTTASATRPASSLAATTLA